MTEDELRAHLATLVKQTCGSTAALARKHKVHPKALTLFLSGARGPSAELARAFGFERKYVADIESLAKTPPSPDSAVREALRDVMPYLEEGYIEDEEDDEPIGWQADADGSNQRPVALTFGMIRKCRAALATPLAVGGEDGR